MELGYQIFGQVINRVRKIADFGHIQFIGSTALGDGGGGGAKHNILEPKKIILAYPNGEQYLRFQNVQTECSIKRVKNTLKR